MGGQSEVQSQEITWDVAGIAVSATLTLPTTTGSHPAVAFVAGSGPTDRDWNSPLIPGSNGSARLLAQDLAHSGFISVRYDKRASGPHAKENVPRLAGTISLQSHVDEFAGAVAAVAARQDVEADHIYALTNSEGAIHALNYQRQAEGQLLAGFVLTGMPGRSIADTMRSQVIPQLSALPDGTEMINHYQEAIADFLARRPVHLDPSLPDALKMVFASLTNPANLPFARELMSVNPAELMCQITQPILVVIGKKDIQVNWQTDGRLLERAVAERDNVSFAYPDNANHVLKYEPKPRDELAPAEVQATYNAEGRVLDRDALATIQRWLAGQAESIQQ